MSDYSVAVVHGNYLAYGGGEVVAEEIARIFDAPLYYGFGNPDAIPENEIDYISLFNDSRMSFIRDFPSIRDVYYMWNWQHCPELHKYDVVIQSGNEMGWYVPPDEQVIIKYTHSTPRTPYDRFIDRGQSTIVRLFSMIIRTLYLPNIPFPDTYVANSELIQRRLNRYWGIKESEVIYPPVDTDSYYSAEPEDYYFTFSRLVPSKGIGEIVDAFNEMNDKRLIVGGTGPQEDELRNSSEDNIEFRGYLSEDEKRDLLSSAKAFVFAAENEDFGIAPVEALASGTPVIGVKEGFTKHQIDHKKNGILFNRGIDNLQNAVEELEDNGVSMSANDIAAGAEKYSKEKFRQDFTSIVEGTFESATIDGPSSQLTDE